MQIRKCVTIPTIYMSDTHHFSRTYLRTTNPKLTHFYILSREKNGKCEAWSNNRYGHSKLWDPEKKISHVPRKEWVSRWQFGWSKKEKKIVIWYEKASWFQTSKRKKICSHREIKVTSANTSWNTRRTAFIYKNCVVWELCVIRAEDGVLNRY